MKLNNSVQGGLCKAKMPDEIYIGDDGFLKCKCDVCKEEIRFSDCYCYGETGKQLIYGHKGCVMQFRLGNVEMDRRL